MWPAAHLERRGAGPCQPFSAVQLLAQNSEGQRKQLTGSATRGEEELKPGTGTLNIYIQFLLSTALSIFYFFKYQFCSWLASQMEVHWPDVRTIIQVFNTRSTLAQTRTTSTILEAEHTEADGKGNARGNNCMKNSNCITCDLPAVTWPHSERPSGLQLSGTTYCSTGMGGLPRTFFLKYFQTAHSQIYPFICISAAQQRAGIRRRLKCTAGRFFLVPVTQSGCRTDTWMSCCLHREQPAPPRIL